MFCFILHYIINKKISINKTRETIEMLKENDIETRMYMILGLPGSDFAPKDS